MADVNLFLRLGVKLDDLQKGLANGIKQVQGFGKNLQSAFTSSVNTSTRHTQKLNDSLSSVGKTAAGVLGGLMAFSGVQAVIQNTIGAGIQWNQQLEVSQSKWETLLGSQEAAADQLKWMADFAASTPFEFESLDTASSRLKAFGFTVEQSRSLLQTLGDAAAATGKGAEGLDALSNSLGKIQGMGKVTTEALNMMADQGINGFKILAEAMGVSEAEIRKMIEKGLVPAGKAIPALQAGLDKAFGGAMAKQAETFTGKMSTLRDNVKMLLGDAFKPVFGWLSGTAMPLAINLVDKLTKGFQTGGLSGALTAIFPPELRQSVQNIIAAVSMLGTWIKQAIIAIAPVAKSALSGVFNIVSGVANFILQHGGAVKALIGGMLAAFLAWKAAIVVIQLVTGAMKALNIVMNLNPIGLIITAIGLLIAAGIALYQNWDTVKRYALNAWGTIKAFIYETIAKILDYYAGFIGIFSKQKAEEARIAAAAARKQASTERELIDQRNEMAAEEAAAKKAAEERKVSMAQAAAEEEARAAQEAAEKEGQLWQQTADDAGAATDKKVEYTEQFSDAWERAQDEATTTFDRAQEDQTETFKRAQEDRLREFEAAQEREKTAFERAQAEKLTTFERAQEDQSTAFDRAQQDQERDFDAAQDREKERYKRHQEDLLDAFKQRQSDELQALKDRQDAEQEALDAEYAGKINALKAQQDAIRAQQDAEAAARRRDEMLQRIRKAEQGLADAQLSGDPGKILSAQTDLAEARQALTDWETDERRKAAMQQLSDQIDALKAEAEAKKQALADTQKTEEDALKLKQEAALTAYQRELADDMTAFEARLAQQKTNFEREQANQKEQFERAQQDRLIAYKAELDDQKQAFEDQQAAALEHFKQMQEDEATAWKRSQEDRKARYKQELADLKGAFKNKLAEQAKFISDWNAGVNQLKALEPGGSAHPASGMSKQQALDTAIGLAKSGKLDEAARLLSDSYGMTVEQARQNLESQVPKFAAGAVAFGPTLGVFGEKEPEAVTPLSWLAKRMQEFAARVGETMGGMSLPRTTFSPTMASAAGGGGGAPMVLQFVVDGREMAEVVTRYQPGVIKRVTGR